MMYQNRTSEAFSGAKGFIDRSLADQLQQATYSTEILNQHQITAGLVELRVENPASVG
jgi:hypothetical protein